MLYVHKVHPLMFILCSLLVHNHPLPQFAEGALCIANGAPNRETMRACATAVIFYTLRRDIKLLHPIQAETRPTFVHVPGNGG